MIGYICAAFSGLIFGATLAMLVVMKMIRKRIRSTTSGILQNGLQSEYSQEIAEYVKECEATTESNLRKKLKKKQPLLIVKLFRKIKQKRVEKKQHKTPQEPLDEKPTPQEQPKEEPVEKKVWYPFYLMLHSIGMLYQGDESLAFLNLNEKDIFGIVKKVSSALTILFDGIGIQKLKRIRCSVILDTINLVMSVLQPLNKDGVKTVYKTTMQGFKEFNKIKNTINLNPFYHLRLFVRKKITNQLVIECAKCAIDVVAIEIVNIYKEKQSA